MPRAFAFAAIVCAALAAFACGDASETPPNLLLVMVDTLRKDHVGAYGYDRDTTPVIDALAKEGLVFDDAVAQSSWTLPSLWSLFTSRYPGELAEPQGYRKLIRRLPDAADTLAEILSRAGYRTISISSSPYTTELFGSTAGFDVRIQEGGASADQLVDRAVEEIDAQPAAAAAEPAPFFLYLHLLDVHAPYAPPPPYDTLFPTRDGLPHKADHRRGRFDGFETGASDAADLAAHRGHVVALYDGGIRFTDNQLGRLIAHLEETGLIGDTVIAIVSDHGEAFWEHTPLERKLDLHVRGKEHWGYGHGHTLFPELVEVPLVLHGRGVPSGRVSGQVRNLDVAPTLLALAGVPLEELRLRGVDLLARHDAGEDADLPAFSQTSISDAEQASLRSARHQLLRLDDRDRLFRLDGPRVIDVSDREPAKLAEHATRLDELLDSFSPEREGETLTLDAETRSALHALGYTE